MTTEAVEQPVEEKAPVQEEGDDGTESDSDDDVPELEDGDGLNQAQMSQVE